VNYEYDLGGLRTKMTVTPGNVITTYAYDAKGHLTTQTDWASQANQFTYDRVSRPRVLARLGHLTSTRTYDRAGRLTDLRHAKVTGDVTIQRHTYTVDKRGNRTCAEEYNGATGDTFTWTYTYDALARIDLATRYVGTDTSSTFVDRYNYDFDLAGNRIRQAITGGSFISSTAYTYDAANRMISNELLGFPVVNLTNDGTNAYTWDRTDRLWSLGAHNYRYNGFGHRLSRQDGSNPVIIYTLDQLAPHVKLINAADGVTTHRYAHTPLDTYQYRLHVQAIFLVEMSSWQLASGLYQLKTGSES
jgi:YD repeat-containing protein